MLFCLRGAASLCDGSHPRAGFFFQGLFRAIRSAFRAVLRSAIGRAFIQILACMPSPAQAVTCAGAAAAMTLAAGGSVVDAVKAAAFAFASMEVFTHVGGVLRDVGLAGNYLAKGLVHGVVGG
jgi:hypothetical protein